MQHTSTHFYAIGLSYKKADAEIRGHFSLDETSKLELLSHAKHNGIESLIVISTCNRTELYGFAEDAALQHPSLTGGAELGKAVNQVRPHQERLVAAEIGVKEHVDRGPMGLDELLNGRCVDRHGVLFARTRGI